MISPVLLVHTQSLRLWFVVRNKVVLIRPTVNMPDNLLA